MANNRALVLIDIQNDFLPGGALAVADGDAVIDVANQLSERFDLVVATQDWHPENHGSFAANHPGKQPGDRIELDGLDQILWPIHCVQRTRGAQFAERLADIERAKVFPKGTNPSVDSYSGFFDNGRRVATGLGSFLKAEGVTDLYLMGLATDYCVLFTVLDACQLGFQSYVVTDGCRAVNLQPGDDLRALDQMKKAGAAIIASKSMKAHE